MMFKHEIDRCIKRQMRDRRRMQQFGNTEQVKLIQQKIDSLYRVREKAPVAKIGANW